MEPQSPNDLRRSSLNGSTKAKYTLYITENNIFALDQFQPDFALQINRKDFSSAFIPKEELAKHHLEKPLSIFAIFGVIEISDVRFLVAVSRAETVGKIGNAEILKIESVKFLTVSRDQYVNFDYESCYDKLERIKEFLKIGFYFSYTYKLHFQFTGRLSFTAKEMGADFGRSHFIWNYKSIKEFLPSKETRKPPGAFGSASDVDLLGTGGSQPSPGLPNYDGRGISTISLDSKSNSQPRALTPVEQFAYQFFVPFIQGYVGIAEEGDLRMILISRRSYLMGGTRYNNRGVDNSGHVANYVETEQLVFHKNSIYRFFQIRGSLPFYWEQVKGLLNPTVEIHQRQDINQEVMGKHISLVTDKGRFKKLVFFNLLSRSKSNEETLSNYLIHLLESLGRTDTFKGKVLYEHVDFHAITKPTDFSPVDKYVYKVADTSNNGGEVGFDEYEWSDLLDCYTQKRAQQGLIRTNCLDCLDRTNAMQTKIGHYMLYKIMERCNSRMYGMFTPEERRNPLPFFEKGGLNFFEHLRKLWANNGDQISVIYAGTGATTSSVTRKGEKSTLTSFLDHKLKTVRRFYLNTFDDNFKQEIIDVLLHKKNQTIRQSTLYQSQMDMVRIEEVTLHVVTLLSIGGNTSLFLTPELIDSIFKGKSEKDLILVVARNDREKNVEMNSKDMNLVCESFLEMFHLNIKPPNPFKMIEDFSEAKFTLMLFAHRDYISRVTYSKSDKINTSNLFQSNGLRTSLIVEHVGIEVFCVKSEKGTFASSVGRSVEKAFDKYIDKEYDLVLFIAHVEGYEPEKTTVSAKYQKLCDEPKQDAFGGRYTNLVLAYGSKDLIEQGFRPEVKRMKLNTEQVTPQLTFNSFTFEIKKTG